MKLMPMHIKKIRKSDVLHKGGVYFHASSVSVSGKALLFLGHSTAGKSTISQLLSKRYSVIADDKVLVSKSNNYGWSVRDASGKFRAWTGTGYPLGRKKHPLLAVLRIYKGPATRIHPITQRETCKYLMDAIFENDFQRNIEDFFVRKNWFKMVAEISNDIEGWRLTFPKSICIIKKIQDVFEERFHSDIKE